MVNPGKSVKIEEGDRIIVFAEERDSGILTNVDCKDLPTAKYESSDTDRTVAIIGYNSSFRTVYEEMLDEISEVIVAGIPASKKDAVMKVASRFKDRKITILEDDIDEVENMTKLAQEVHHIVLLSDYTMDDEDADIQSIFRIMRFRDIRTKLGLKFNITAEMCKKANLNLIREDEHMDYVASSNMSSLFLAQLSENYELTPLIKEILDNDGNELRLKKAKDFGINGIHTTQQLRSIALSNNYTLLGYLRHDTYESTFNPNLTDEIDLDGEDSLIVLAEN
jgi:hypothetical protein